VLKFLSLSTGSSSSSSGGGGGGSSSSRKSSSGSGSGYKQQDHFERLCKVAPYSLLLFSSASM
jgi:hypothetical protein